MVYSCSTEHLRMERVHIVVWVKECKVKTMHPQLPLRDT